MYVYIYIFTQALKYLAYVLMNRGEAMDSIESIESL